LEYLSGGASDPEINANTNRHKCIAFAFLWDFGAMRLILLQVLVH
jgi:hypothetical protein